MLIGRVNKLIGKDVTGNVIGSIVGSPQFGHLSGRTKKITRKFRHDLPSWTRSPYLHCMP